MRLFKPANRVIFADDKVERDFNSLREVWLKKALTKAISDFKENAFYGVPNAWRLVYSVFGNENELFVMIVEYMTHKEYEKRFHY